MLRICSLLVLILAPLPAVAEVAGTLRVIDGDTIDVGDTRVRLHGVDAPEIDQRCGGGDAPMWDCGAWVTRVVTDRYEGRDTIEAISEKAAPGATVITDGSSIWYMTLVEDRRTDLKIISPFLEDDLESEAEGRWLRFTRRHMKKDETVYIVASNGISGESLALLHEAGYRLIPREGGTFYKVVYSPKAPAVSVKLA